MSIHLDRHQVWQDKSHATIQTSAKPTIKQRSSDLNSQSPFIKTVHRSITQESHGLSQKNSAKFGTFNPPSGVRYRSAKDMARLLPALINNSILHNSSRWGISETTALKITYEVEFNPTDGRMQNIKLNSNELTDKQLNQIAKYMMVRGRILGLQFEEGLNASATLEGKIFRT